MTDGKLERCDPIEFTEDDLRRLEQQRQITREEHVRLVATLRHAQLAKRIATRELRWIAQTVHQAHHDGPINDCLKTTCRAARDAVAVIEGAKKCVS